MALSAKDWKGTASLSTLGLEVVVALVLGLMLGRWLDGKFGTAPYLAVAGFTLGLFSAVKAFVRTWREMQRITAQEEREQGNPAPLYDDPQKEPGAPPEGETPSPDTQEKNEPPS